MSEGTVFAGRWGRFSDASSERNVQKTSETPRIHLLARQTGVNANEFRDSKLEKVHESTIHVVVSCGNVRERETITMVSGQKYAPWKRRPNTVIGRRNTRLIGLPAKTLQNRRSEYVF